MLNRPSNDGFLVIGYGNTLRGDDGAGPAVIEKLQVGSDPRLRAISRQLLTPELAETVASAGNVVFVDASIDSTEGALLRDVSPSESSRVLGHASSPAEILAVARDVFGKTPRAWLLTLPGVQFDFGNHFSETTRRAIAEAVTVINGLVGRSNGPALDAIPGNQTMRP